MASTMKIMNAMFDQLSLPTQMHFMVERFNQLPQERKRTFLNRLAREVGETSEKKRKAPVVPLVTALNMDDDGGAYHLYQDGKRITDEPVRKARFGEVYAQYLAKRLASDKILKKFSVIKGVARGAAIPEVHYEKAPQSMHRKYGEPVKCRDGKTLRICVAWAFWVDRSTRQPGNFFKMAAFLKDEGVSAEKVIPNQRRA